MNVTKFESIHRGLSSIAKKVFEATPINEPWACATIVSEMRRLGSGADQKIIMGCLNTMIDLGLVVEPMKGHFQRVEVRAKCNAVAATAEQPNHQQLSQPQQAMPHTPSTQSLPTAATSPIDRLSMFAIRLRELANDMESAALDISEQAEINDAQTAKMRQLQQLLKSLA